MKDKIKSTEINVNKENIIPIADVKQESQCELNLKLFKDNIPFNISNQTVRLSALLPSGNKQEQFKNIKVNQNELNIILNNSIVSEFGKVELELTFTDSAGFMTTASFYLNVTKKVFDKNTVESSFYIESIETLIKNTKNTNEQLMKEFAEDYSTLKKIIIDENQAAELQSQINDKEKEIEINKKNIKENYFKDSYMRGEFKENQKACVVFIADDGDIKNYTELLPIIKEKKIKIGLAILPDKTGEKGYMNIEQVKEFVDLGNELLSHGSSIEGQDQQDFRNLTDEELRFCIKNAKEKIEEKWNVYCNGIVYPFNSTDMRVKKIVKEFHRFAFGRYNVLSSSKNISGFNYYPYQFDNFDIKRVSIGYGPDEPMEGFPQDTNSLEYFKARFDDALKNKALICYMLHTGLGDFESQKETIKQLIDYIREKNVDILTPSEAFAKKGNCVQIGYVENRNEKCIINNIGEIDSKSLLYNQIRANTHTPEDSILTEYPLEKITVEIVTTSHSQKYNFPGGKAGILKTYKYTSESFAMFQIFESYGIEYKRLVDEDFNWLPWELTDKNIVLYNGINKFNSNKSILNYDKGKIIIDEVNNAYASSQNLPKKKAGRIITFNLSTEYYLRKQIFEISSQLNNGTSEEYERIVNRDNTWSEWTPKGKGIIVRTIPSFTLQPNSTTNIEIGGLTPYTTNDISSMYINFPQGLIWQEINTGAIRIANITGEEIVVPETSATIVYKK